MKKNSVLLVFVPFLFTQNAQGFDCGRTSDSPYLKHYAEEHGKDKLQREVMGCINVPVPDQPAGKEREVTIQAYIHHTCEIAGGKSFLPAHAQFGEQSIYRIPTEVERCEAMIQLGMMSCGWAVRHVSELGDRKYPACIPRFRAQVSKCRQHYDRQKHKCGPQ